MSVGPVDQETLRTGTYRVSFDRPVPINKYSKIIREICRNHSSLRQNYDVCTTNTLTQLTVTSTEVPD